MENVEARLAAAENTIKELTKVVQQQDKQIKELSKLIQPLTSNRAFADAVKVALHQIQRNG